MEQKYRIVDSGRYNKESSQLESDFKKTKTKTNLELQKEVDKKKEKNKLLNLLFKVNKK